ncbi:MAG: M28 family peptidase, partial [Bacteroidota bacterium]
MYTEYAENALRIIKDIITKHGPRVSGTKSCYSAVAELELILAKFCKNVRHESFSIHPNSLYSIGKIFTVLYCIGLVSVLVGNKLILAIGLLLMLTGILYFMTNFILYLDTFDIFFKKTEGRNVVGIVEPKDVVKQQVIIVGHHDSSYIYPFYEKMPLLFPIRLIVPILLLIFCTGVLVVLFLSGISMANVPLLPVWIKYTLLAGLVFVLPMYGYISKRQSPGAGDNLIGCAIGITLAQFFQEADYSLKNTRLVVLLTDGEEAGQKGAKFFIKNNRSILDLENTIVINLDSIYNYEDLALVKRERNGFTKLSTKMVMEIRTVAEGLGHHFKEIVIPFGGGGTDGGQFARKGIETVSIIGMPTDILRKEIIFHTMKDMPEKISIKAVNTIIEVVSEYI